MIYLIRHKLKRGGWQPWEPVYALTRPDALAEAQARWGIARAWDAKKAPPGTPVRVDIPYM